jgi:hypothetical protein
MVDRASLAKYQNKAGWPGQCGETTDIESLQNRLLKVCYVPCSSARLPRLLFIFLLWPLTVLIKQTRQVVRAIKKSILLRCLWERPTVLNLPPLLVFPATTTSKNLGVF